MRIIPVLALSVVLAAGLNAPGVTQAQEQEKYIDLSVEFTVKESNSSNDFSNVLWLSNSGNQTAYDVRVVLRQVSPTTTNRISMSPCCHLGTIDVDSNTSVTSNKVTWSLDSLPPHTQSFITFRSGHASTDKVLYEWSATAESLSSYESPDRLHDNTAEAFLWATIRLDLPQPSYYVRVSTAGGSSEPGGTAEFTVDVLNKYDDDSNEFGDNPTGEVSFVSDACVNMWLSPGLTAGTATVNSDTRFPNLQYYPKGQRACGGTTAASGVLYVGGPVNLSVSPQPKLTLPVTVGDTGPYCLTAEIFARPPTGAGLHRDDPADNRIKVCLDPAPAGEQVVLNSGTVDLFTWYDCVGKTAAPCNRKDDGDATTNDDLQLVAFAGTAAEDVGIFQPSQVVVHVPDPSGRAQDPNGSLVWSTGFPAWGDCDTDASKCLPGGVDRPGTMIARNTAWLDLESTIDDDRWGTPHTNTAFAAYETGYVMASASAPDSGKMTIYRRRGSDNSRLLLWSTAADGVKYEATAEILARTPELGYSSADNGPMYAEFTKMGAYEMTLKVKADYETNVNDTTGGNNPTPPTNHEDEETYTFYVGPLANLEVRAGSDATAGRTTLTVLASNHGPEREADARVKITLPAGALVEDYVASEGTYDNGTWTLPRLKMRDYRRSQGKPEEATLTLILKEGGGLPKEPATATISLTDNSYNVCIGTVGDSKGETLTYTTQATCEAHDEDNDNTGDGSWHQGTIYDPPANNTAKIDLAVPGASGASGASKPGAPSVPSASSNSRSVTLSWNTVKLVNTMPVGHYEVQKYIGDEGRGSWQTVSGPVPDTQWTDFNVGSGQPSPYRVRAVNWAGYGGPWSAQVNRLTAAQQGQLSAPVLTAKTTTHDTVRLTWTEPTNQQDAITGYELEHLHGDTWTALESLLATEREYEHLHLGPGEQWSYRVRALSGAGPGRWSNVAVTETPPGLPILWAEPNGPSSILITWDPGSYSVSRYELEVSTEQDGTYSRLANPSGTARSYNHSVGAINPEVRYYRIRACNSAGCGDWTWPESATTAAQGVPSAPGLTVRSSSASEIKLSWSKPHDGGSEITGYHLEHFTDGQDWENLYLDHNLDTEYAHQQEFGGGTTHRYRVRAVNAKGEGAWSTVRSVTIPAGLPEAPTLSFPDDAATDNSITLAWMVPETHGARISGYRIERNEYLRGIENWVLVTTVGGSATSYTDRNLYSYSNYCYRVAATSNVGTGAWSEMECEFTTGDWIPTDPPILRLSSVSATGVTVAWDPPLLSGGRPVTGYVWEMSPFHDDCEYATHDRELWPEDKCFQVSASQRTVTLRNLTPGETHSLRVRTVTADWDSDWAEVDAHLPIAASDDPDTTGVTEDLQVRLSTTAVTVNEGSGVARYTVRLNKAPQVGETVSLDWYQDGIADIFVDYQASEPNCYSFVFNRDNWSSGCTFTLSAYEDRNSDNEMAIMEHSIVVGGREVSGPGVRVEVRDND